MDSSIDPSIGAQAGIFTKFSLENDLAQQQHTEDAQGAAHAALLAHQQGGYHYQSQDASRGPLQMIHHHGDVDEANAAAAAAAAAAASANLSSIINFNQMENDATETVHSHAQEIPHQLPHQLPPRDKHQSQLTFLQSALSINHASDDGSSSSRVNHQHTVDNNAPPKQKLIKDPNSNVSIVVVNPASKDGNGRLGRPRRLNGLFEGEEGERIARTLKVSANNNKEECLVSKFRVDSKPIMGPGSRGGKGKTSTPRKSADSTTTTPQGSKFVNFAINKEQPSESTPPIEVAQIAQHSAESSSTGPQQGVFQVQSSPSRALPPLLANTISNERPTSTDDASSSANATSGAAAIESSETASPPEASPNVGNSFILEDYASLKAKGRSVQKDKQDVFTKLGLVPLMPKKQAMDTAAVAAAAVAVNNAPQSAAQPEKKTITRQRRSKPAITKARDLKRKDIPGPLTPAYWDAYDPEILKLDELQEQGDDQMIALGYTLKPAPFAKDIMFILSFIAKFKKFFGDMPNLGPQDFEEGLKLTTPQKYEIENSKQADVQVTYEDDFVSENMHRLLRELLTLVLNRKKPIAKSGMTKALYDLKALVLNMGLPAEWRDDTGVYTPPLIDESLKNPENEEPVDPNNNEFFDTIQYQYSTTKPLDHTPLDNEDFEETGLQSLKPSDRIVLLKTMCHWACAHSDAVRKEINVQIAKQDSSGEKETYYVSRFIKDGEEGVDGANSSLKLHPRKKIKKADDAENSVADAYTDASVNPMDHHMSFRLLDFFAGDGGVNGRFFLCRSADNTTGGFSSVTELKDLTAADKSTSEMLGWVQPSRFKLYVEDVTTILTSSLEVETQLIGEKPEAFDPWYEVASNSEELNAFVQFVEQRLETFKSKKLSNLVAYLKSLIPVLQKFEAVYTEYTSLQLSRDSRKRSQVTDLKANDRKLRKVLKQSENPESEFLRDDSDEDMDEAEEEEYAGQEGDDANDDDYRD